MPDNVIALRSRLLAREAEHAAEHEQQTSELQLREELKTGDAVSARTEQVHVRNGCSRTWCCGST
ncbi:MAG TPA: hypothetical protein VFN42_08820, partial [Acetobacteraceae bacterium]|nr:hypothetical protein [Acetobacteraceae bacterium]